MQEVMDRILGFMPQSTVFFVAVSTTLLAVLIQLVHNWFLKKVTLPWMREDNQKARNKILGKDSQSKQEAGKKEEV